MQTSAKSYTTGSVLAALGYPDPLVAARQQARMIPLGRLARYQAAIQQLESQWERSCALVTQLRGAKILQPMMTICSGEWSNECRRLCQRRLWAIIGAGHRPRRHRHAHRRAGGKDAWTTARQNLDSAGSIWQ